MKHLHILFDYLRIVHSWNMVDEGYEKSFRRIPFSTTMKFEMMSVLSHLLACFGALRSFAIRYICRAEILWVFFHFFLFFALWVCVCVHIARSRYSFRACDRTFFNKNVGKVNLYSLCECVWTQFHIRAVTKTHHKTCKSM